MYLTLNVHNFESFKFCVSPNFNDNFGCSQLRIFLLFYEHLLEHFQLWSHPNLDVSITGCTRILRFLTLDAPKLELF